MRYTLNDFVHQQNIRLFEEKLAEEADPEKRELLLKLLAAEKALRLPSPGAHQP
jgi:hypothetical protein